MNNIFTNKKIYEMLGKSKGPGKLTDLSGDGKVTKKDVLIGRGVLPKPPKSTGPAKTRAEMRLEKTKMKAKKAKDSANKANDGSTNASKEKMDTTKAKADRLAKRQKRQEGRAERKKIRKNKDLSRGDKRKQMIDSREKQKSKNPVVEKKKPNVSEKEIQRKKDFEKNLLAVNKNIVLSDRQKKELKNTTTKIEGRSTMGEKKKI